MKSIITSRSHEAFRQSPGFTLLELLVVVAIIGILAGLLLSSLSQAKSRAHRVTCANNQRQLTVAFLLYVDDYDDALPYNLGDGETKKYVNQSKFMNWVNNVMSWELDSDNTNTARVVEGGLGPYCSRVASLYRCPTDSAVSDLQRSAGWRSRVRSISMNAMIGDAGEFTTTGANVNNPYYRQFFKLSQIQDPSRIFVFIEEHPDSIGDGYFLNRPDSYEWTDLPASYHNGGANLSFADGHLEYHRWQQGGTKPAPTPGSAHLPFRVTEGTDSDFEWLMSRTSQTSQTGYKPRY